MTSKSILAQKIEAALKLASAALYVPPKLKNQRDYMCRQEGCPNKALSKGLCNAHYIRARTGRDMDVPLQHRLGGNCSDCGEPVGSKGGWGLCKKHYRVLRRKTIRAVCIEYLGGACKHCSGVFPHVAYDFHHKDPATKEHSPSSMIDNCSVDLIAKEIEGCELLCANCHRIEHFT